MCRLGPPGTCSLSIAEKINETIHSPFEPEYILRAACLILYPRYGWGVLCLAGGGAYYFAKKSVNADRAARHEAEMRKQARLHRLEVASNSPPPPLSKKKTPRPSSNITGESGVQHKGLDHAGSPSSEASEEEAPVGHAPVTPEQKVRERSKYEAAEVYRSKKGDRFS